MKRITMAFAFLIILSCGGGDSGGGSDPKPDPVPDPVAATLVFPDNNTECNEGTIVSDTQSTVTFEWNASQNTDSYDVNLTDLSTSISVVRTANINSLAITIERGVPYEWFVVSKATGTSQTATSPSWKFYNQGLGVENYAPFPAEAINPKRGATIPSSGTVLLEWTGNDVDNDLTGFDVLFGTDSDPVNALGTTPQSTIEATITSGQVYYWRVISKDGQNNSSQSEIFEFKVQ